MRKMHNLISLADGGNGVALKPMYKLIMEVGLEMIY